MRSACVVLFGAGTLSIVEAVVSVGIGFALALLSVGLGDSEAVMGFDLVFFDEFDGIVVQGSELERSHRYETSVPQEGVHCRQVASPAVPGQFAKVVLDRVEILQAQVAEIADQTGVGGQGTREDGIVPGEADLKELDTLEVGREKLYLRLLGSRSR